jgi:hypothetical protein
MRELPLLLCLCLSISANAQYGSFDASTVKKARANTTIVVLDDGDTPYNRAVMNAVKADWKYSGDFDFLKVSDLAMEPIAPEKNYLLKITKVDPSKHEGTFLTLIQGWKPKKGETLQNTDNAFTNIPVQQELAFILIDDKGMNEKNTAPMVTLYLKHLQNYLQLVENGKITDKTTADRTYAGRNRLIRDTELWMGKEHLDQTMPEEDKVQAVYTSKVQIKPVSQLMDAIEKQDKEITITDVVITGEHKTKHCFKRIFNAGTGELMFLRDDQALHGKKEGFLDEDMKTIERAR